MTEDLRRTFENALPDSLPAAEWDSYDMERRAQKSLRRQRIGYAAATLCVLAAISVALPTVLPEASPRPSTTAPVQQPEYSIPKLQDGKKYVWGGEGEWTETEETKKIHQAFWEQISTFPGVRMANPSDASDSALIAEADLPPVARVESQLFATDEIDGKQPVLDDSGEPYYRPNYQFPANSDARHSVFRFDDAANDDDISLRVHPKGSFVAGRPDEAVPHPLPGPSPHDAEYLADSCESFIWEEGTEDEREATFECDETTISEGTVLATERTDRYSNGATTVSRTVVQYRLDGTAVVVENLPATKDESGNAQATLGIKALIEIAESIPNLTVR